MDENGKINTQKMSHAESIALKICDNTWWHHLDTLLPKKVGDGCSTERELCIKRLNYWINNYEGDITSEAPMYATMLGQDVMKIIDKAINSTKQKQD